MIPHDPIEISLGFIIWYPMVLLWFEIYQIIADSFRAIVVFSSIDSVSCWVCVLVLHLFLTQLWRIIKCINKLNCQAHKTWKCLIRFQRDRRPLRFHFYRVEWIVKKECNAVSRRQALPMNFVFPLIQSLLNRDPSKSVRSICTGCLHCFDINF
jgi:hypothetical protein